MRETPEKGLVMFKIGDVLSYRATGVCRVEDIREETLTGEKKTYYILKPVLRNSSTIYVPMDNEILCGRMAALLSKTAAAEILGRSCASAASWVEDAKARQAAFSAVISGGDRAAIADVVRLLSRHKREVAELGRKFYASDERLLNTAMNAIAGELAYVLERDEKEVAAALCEE